MRKYEVTINCVQCSNTLWKTDVNDTRKDNECCKYSVGQIDVDETCHMCRNEMRITKIELKSILSNNCSLCGEKRKWRLGYCLVDSCSRNKLYCIPCHKKHVKVCHQLFEGLN